MDTDVVDGFEMRYHVMIGSSVVYLELPSCTHVGFCTVRCCSCVKLYTFHISDLLDWSSSAWASQSVNSHIVCVQASRSHIRPGHLE